MQRQQREAAVSAGAGWRVNLAGHCGQPDPFDLDRLHDEGGDALDLKDLHDGLSATLAQGLWVGICPFCDALTPWPWYAPHCGQFACWQAYESLCTLLQYEMAGTLHLIRERDGRSGIGRAA